MLKITPEMCKGLIFLKLPKAAEYYDLDGRTLVKLIKANKIPFMRINNEYRVAVWVDEYAEYCIAKKKKQDEQEKAKYNEQ